MAKSQKVDVGKKRAELEKLQAEIENAERINLIIDHQEAMAGFDVQKQWREAEEEIMAAAKALGMDVKKGRSGKSKRTTGEQGPRPLTPVNKILKASPKTAFTLTELYNSESVKAYCDKNGITKDQLAKYMKDYADAGKIKTAEGGKFQFAK